MVTPKHQDVHRLLTCWLSILRLRRRAWERRPGSFAAQDWPTLVGWDPLPASATPFDTWLRPLG